MRRIEQPRQLEDLRRSSSRRERQDTKAAGEREEGHPVATLH